MLAPRNQEPTDQRVEFVEIPNQLVAVKSYRAALRRH
jgi:hypothetical protein